MTSFTRIKKLCILTGHLLKSEAVLPYCTLFHKTLCTSNVLNSNGKIYKANDFENYAASNIQQNLSTIVDLGVDFNDVAIDSEESKTRRKRRVKKMKQPMEAVCEEQNIEEKKSDLEETGTTETETETKTKTKPKIPANQEEGDTMFSKVMSKLKSTRGKEKNQKVILEGKRLIHDAISAGCIPEKIFYSRQSDLEKLNVPDNVKLFKTSYKSFKLWSDVVTPQGVAGVFKMPNVGKSKEKRNSIPLTIICDNIREPGNLGTILRLSAGVGCKKLILTKGCVSIWEPKVLRSAAGAHFHMPVRTKLLWSEIENEISEECKVFVADTNSQAVNNTVDTENKTETGDFKVISPSSEKLPVCCYSSVKFTNEDTVIVIGGETYGLCNEAYEFAEKRKGARIFIPLMNDIESLNNSVALGILAYEFKRQLNLVQESQFTEVENADSEIQSKQAVSP